MDIKDLPAEFQLSNKIFKMKLKSLVDISTQSLCDFEIQNNEFISNFRKRQESISRDDLFDKGAYLQNAEWILLNSIFIAAFSYFEYHLFVLAKILESNISSKVKIEHINGNGIVKYANYLYLIGSIKSSDQSRGEWQEIPQFNKVRNLLAHNGGKILSESKGTLEKHKLYNFLEKHNVVMAGPSGIIRIRKIDFIEAFKNSTGIISDNLVQELSSLQW